MCRFFDVSESGYYAFRNRPSQESRDKQICALIAQCQQESKHTYGYRRVCLWLRARTGAQINHKAVLRVMRKYGLLARVRRKRQYSYYGEYLLEYPNLLNRNFWANKPNKIVGCGYFLHQNGARHPVFVRYT
jgi:hypothetical protein